MSLAFAPDGKRLAACDFEDRIVQVWDTISYKELVRFESGRVSVPVALSLNVPLVFLPDGKTIATALVDFSAKENDKGKGFQLTGKAELRYWDAANGQLREKRKLPVVVAVDFSDDASTALALEYAFVKDKPAARARVFDLATGKERYVHESFETELFRLAPDGRRLIAVRPDENRKLHLKVLDETGKELQLVSLERDKGRLMSHVPRLTPDGSAVVGHDDTGAVYVWDMKSAKLHWKLPPGKGKPRCHSNVAISPDSRTAAVAVGDDASPSTRDLEDWGQPSIIIWDLSTGQRRDTLVAPPGGICSLAFSPDGTILASGSLGVVWLWDVRETSAGKK